MARITMILEENGKVVHEVKVEPVDIAELKKSGYYEKGSKPEPNKEVVKRGRKKSADAVSTNGSETAS